MHSNKLRLLLIVIAQTIAIGTTLLLDRFLAVLRGLSYHYTSIFLILYLIIPLLVLILCVRVCVRFNRIFCCSAQLDYHRY